MQSPELKRCGNKPHPKCAPCLRLPSNESERNKIHKNPKHKTYIQTNQTKPNQIKQPEEKRQKNLTQFQNVGSNFPSPRLSVCLSFVPIATHEVKQNNKQKNPIITTKKNFLATTTTTTTTLLSSEANHNNHE